MTLRPNLMLFAVLSFLVLTVPASAQVPDLSGFEPVIIPLHGVNTGAYGAVFSSEFSAVAPRGFLYYAGGTSIQQHYGSEFLNFSKVDYPPARVLWIDRNTAPRTWFHAALETRDATGLHDSVTLVPVVRESDLVRGKSIVFPVTGGTTRRHRIRIYTTTARAITFRVESCAMGVNQPTEESCSGEGSGPNAMTLTAIPPADGDRSVPTYAEADITDLARCIQPTAHSSCIFYPRMLAIVPDDGSVGYWVMASTTDNVTQQVRLAVPQ